MPIDRSASGPHRQFAQIAGVLVPARIQVKLVVALHAQIEPAGCGLQQ